MFEPKKEKVECATKSMRMPVKLIEQLERLAAEKDMSFSMLMRQCAVYAMEHNKELTSE